MWLRHSAAVVLSNRQGGSADLGGPYDFSASATTAWAPAAVGGVLPAGSYRPFGNLAAFNGLNANGSWQLVVADQAGADVGTVSGWSVTLTCQ